MSESAVEGMEQAIAWVAAARKIAVLTGAGVSKESGIPTFRDAMTGLWADFNPEELASPQGFQRNPTRVWQWYAARRGQLDEVQPNPAHHALARLERSKPVTVITQNVDGLHQQAGSTRVLELHGSLRGYKCFAHEHPVTLETVAGLTEPPACPECGSLVRPAVVWFGELLPSNILQQAMQAATACDLMLVIGTSGIVHPAASLPVYAQEAGARTIEINPERSAISHRLDLYLAGAAGALVPALVAGAEQALGAATPPAGS